MTKIFMSGCSGSGKTTVAKLLSDKTGLSIIDGVARKSPHKIGTKENQDYIYHELGRQFWQDGIHCRTIIDVAAYSDLINHYHYYLFDDFWGSYRHHPLVYFPYPDWGIEDDGFRPTDEDTNRRVDSFIKERLDSYNIKYLHLSAKSPEDRVEEILDFWSEYGSFERLLGYRDQPNI